MSLHPIPAEALAHHLAFLGKTGSGKSNAAKVIVEEALDAGERVCVLDPTGAWWGLRLQANGKPSKYPVVIFGGLHADVQIGASHGEAVAEVVATSATPAVIDTRLMTVGERTAFFTAFAQTLLRKNRGPLRLVIDEAHVFAPQGRVADPRSGEMLHAANNLVSLGRSIGLRIALISQRPAKLHKDSLSQVETLVAMRLVAPQDRGAIEDWIGEWSDKSQGKEIIASLPSLPTGDAWIWSPEAGVLERAHFPLAKTYDSGQAPTGDDGAPELQPINLASINALLDEAAADIKANDPRALKAEVARLTRELAKAQNAGAPEWPDQREQVAVLTSELAQTSASLERVTAAAKQLQRRHDAILAALQGERIEIEQPTKKSARKWSIDYRHVEAGVSKAPNAPREARKRTESVPVGDVTPPQRRILDALAWWRAFGIEQPKSEQVAFIAGYSASSSGYANLKGAMRTAGLIDYPVPGHVCLTDAGNSHANGSVAEPSRDEFHRRVKAKLSGSQVRILEPLIAAYPDALSSDDLAASSRYSSSSSGYANLKGNMRTLGFLDYPSPGQVRAADWLFP